MAICQKAKKKTSIFKEFSSKFIVSLTAGCCVMSRKHKCHDF